MKRVGSERLSLEAARQALGTHIDPAWLRFAVRHLAYPEVSADADGTVTYPGYVPVPALLAEVAAATASGALTLRTCGECGECFDIDKADGIFGDYDALERFVCRSCAESVTAWDFWQRHVVG